MLAEKFEESSKEKNEIELKITIKENPLDNHEVYRLCVENSKEIISELKETSEKDYYDYDDYEKYNIAWDCFTEGEYLLEYANEKQLEIFGEEFFDLEFDFSQDSYSRLHTKIDLSFKKNECLLLDEYLEKMKDIETISLINSHGDIKYPCCRLDDNEVYLYDFYYTDVDEFVKELITEDGVEEFEREFLIEGYTKLLEKINKDIIKFLNEVEDKATELHDAEFNYIESDEYLFEEVLNRDYFYLDLNQDGKVEIYDKEYIRINGIFLCYIVKDNKEIFIKEGDNVSAEFVERFS